MSQLTSGKLSNLLDMELSSSSGSYGRRAAGKPVVIAGVILDIKTRITKTGSKIATITLDDGSARLETVVFTKVFDEFQSLLVSENVVVIEGSLSFDDFAGVNRVKADVIRSSEGAREHASKDLIVEFNENASADLVASVKALHEIIKKFTGGRCPVKISYTSTEAKLMLNLAENWCVYPTDELLDALKVAFPTQEKFIRF
jgi:DNA polymerase-3 subunit alpha